MDTLNNCEVRTDYAVKKKGKVYQKKRKSEKLLDTLHDCFVENKVKVYPKRRETVLDALDDCFVKKKVKVYQKRKKSYWMHSTTVRSGRIMLLILCTTDWTTSRMLK